MPLLERMISVPSLGTRTPTLEMESRSVSRGAGFTIVGGDAMAHGEEETAPIVKAGYLRKLKTMKRKWFVLLGQTSSQPARLTYYDTEKNWRSRGLPKRDIILDNIFNISRKRDTRDSVHKPVIGIYTLQDCVSILFENEKEMTDWLETLLSQQQSKTTFKTNYQYLWQVSIKAFKPDSRNGSQLPNLVGPHRLCVTNAHVKFFPMGLSSSLDIPHGCIRSCAHSDRVFRLVTGRKSPCGPGSIVIICDAKDVTQQLHETVLNAMKSTRSIEQDTHKNPQRSWSRATSDSESNPKEASRNTSPCAVGKRVRSVSDCEGSGSAPTNSYSVPLKTGSVITKTGSVMSGTSIGSYGSLIGTGSYGSILDSSGTDILLDRPSLARSRNHSGIITDGEGSGDWKWPGMVSPILSSYTSLVASLVSPVQHNKLADIIPIDDGLLNQSEYIDCDFGEKDNDQSDYVSMSPHEEQHSSAIPNIECLSTNLASKSPERCAKTVTKENHLSLTTNENCVQSDASHLGIIVKQGEVRFPSRNVSVDNDYMTMDSEDYSSHTNPIIQKYPNQNDYMAMDRDEELKNRESIQEEEIPMLSTAGRLWSYSPTFPSSRRPTNSISTYGSDEDSLPSSLSSGLSPSEPQTSTPFNEVDEYLSMDMLTVSETSKSPSSSTLVPMADARKKKSNNQDVDFSHRKSSEYIRCSMTRLDCRLDCKTRTPVSRVPDSCSSSPVHSEKGQEMVPADDIYMPVYYPRQNHTSTSSLVSSRISSPSSPRSGISLTDTKYSSFHLEKVVSRLRNDDEDTNFTKTLPARVSSNTSHPRMSNKTLSAENQINTLPTRALVKNETALSDEAKPEVRTIPRRLSSRSKKRNYTEDTAAQSLKHSVEDTTAQSTGRGSRGSWSTFAVSPPRTNQSNSVVSRLQGLLRNHTGSIPVLIHQQIRPKSTK